MPDGLSLLFARAHAVIACSAGSMTLPERLLEDLQKKLSQVCARLYQTHLNCVSFDGQRLSTAPSVPHRRIRPPNVLSPTHSYFAFLAELPTQMMSYFKANNIAPPPKQATAVAAVNATAVECSAEENQAAEIGVQLLQRHLSG